MGDRLARRWLKVKVNLSLAILLAVSGLFPALQSTGMRTAFASDTETIIHVTVTGGVYQQDGLSWETAMPGDRLQDAIDGAPEGAQVWVAAGMYYPTEDVWDNTDPADPRTKTFHLRNNISVYGGFAGTENSLDERDLESNETVLSGNLGDPDSDADNVYHVFYHPNGSDLNETAVLDGVTITVGKADGSAAINQSGGGMYGDNVSPTLRNVTFNGNEALDNGGGLYANGRAPTMTNVAFRDNTAGSGGGGLYANAYYAGFSIQDAEFTGNSAASGGGFRLDQGTANLENVTFENNEAGTTGGAGIYVNGTYTTLNLTGATLIGNTSAGQGGGIRSYNATLNLANVTISGNTGTAGGGIYSNGKLELTDATIEGNTASADAGGIYSAYEEVRMTNVAFRGNKAGGDGGGLYISEVDDSWQQVVLTNLLFSGNTADSRGGGLFLAYIYDVDPVLTNVTMAGNVASQGGGLYIGSSDYVYIRNSIIWGNTAASDANVFNSYGARYSHSLIEGSGGSGEGWVAAFGADQGGNIDDDPGFADHLPAEGTPTTAGDYRLTEGSPAIDAGDGDVFAAGVTPDLSGVTTDLAGDDRFYNDIVDMGAYEWSLTEPSIIHVTVDGSGLKDGSSWDNAYPGTKLQNAIDGAVAGSEVRVAAGTYYPTKEAGGTGDRFRAFQLKNGVAIYGGFPANPGPDTDMEDRDWKSNPTILSGDLDVQGSNSDNAYHVIHIPADMTLDDTAVLDGFTITGGNADGVGQAQGGGILMESGSPTLRNLLIEGNEASLSGGGLHLENSSPGLEQVTFKRNKAGIVGGGANVGLNGQLYLSDGIFEDNESEDSGGGLGVFGNGAVAELKNVTISGNKAAGEGGGGIYSKATLKLEDATIKDNTNTKPSGSLGGGVYQTGSTLTMTRVTLEGNTASQGGALALYISGTATLNDVKANRNTAGINGGGIVVFGAVTLTATNVTVAGNEAESGGGLYINSSLSVTLTNVLVSGNKATNTGGGFVAQNGKPVLTNVTISGNTSANGGGFYQAPNSKSETFVRNSIIWGNNADEGKNVLGPSGKIRFSNSLIEGSGGSENWNTSIGTNDGGNIDANPGFVDAKPATEAPTAKGDYKLTDTSPAIDAGDGDVFKAGATPDLSEVDTDLAGEERVRYTAVDMGAYELIDEVDPAITEFTPKDGEKDVKVDAELKLVFREPVRPFVGKKIKVWASDDTLAAEVDASQTTWEGAEVTVALPSDLQYGKDYYVTIDQGAFVDRALNAIPAITGKTDWTFSTVKADELKLEATGYNRQIRISWNAVSGADSYEIYRRTSDQSFGSPITDWKETEATFAGLTNGITHYFKVRAMKSGMAIAESDEVSATPMTVPGAPTGVTAVAGDGQATVSFTAPADNGGGEIAEYVVTASPGGKTAAGTSSPITVTGLTNGTSYTFTVLAVNKAGTGEASAESNAVIPQGSSGGEPGNEQPGEEEPGNEDPDEEEPGNGQPGGGSNNPGPSQPDNPAPETPAAGNTGVDVLVNGKSESAGTMTTGTRNGQTMTTVTLDENRLEERLAEEGRGTVVTVPVNTGSEIVVGELNGRMVKSMEASEAVVEIRTERAAYTLPARQINIDALSGQIGAEVELRDIKVRIEIAEPAADTVRVVESAAADGSFTLVVPPIEFTVRAVHEDTVIEVEKFTAYVERLVAIPDGADPSRITTAVVVDPDGTVRHVPTRVELIDGRYYARVSSLTNSTYTVIWHPVEFADVPGHWAKASVNEMGSRMVIEGVGGGLFEPGREMTRAEFAAVIVRALGLKPEADGVRFKDVRESDRHSGAVRAARSYGLISGFADGTFRPDEKITREQAMTILARAMELTNLKARLPEHPDNEALRPYTDAEEVSGWALAGMADAIRAGIVNGRNGTELAPKAFITRAEAAVLIERLLRKSGLI